MLAPWHGPTTLMESLLAAKRAGADAIITCAALDVAEHLRSGYATTAGA